MNGLTLHNPGFLGALSTKVRPLYPAVDTSFAIGSGFLGELGTNAYLFAVEVDAQDRILVGGEFTSYNGYGVGNITRLNADGTRDNTFSAYVGGYAPRVSKISFENSTTNIIISGQGGGNWVKRLYSNGSEMNSYSFPNRVITHTVQPDNKILVGGEFQWYQNYGDGVMFLGRLNTDGTQDSTFNIGTGFNQNIQSIALQADGKIVAGGYFTTFNGSTVNYIVRLNANGSLDTSFNTGVGFNNGISSIVIQSDGKIVIGGNFTSYNGSPANHLIRLNTDGSVDATFNMSAYTIPAVYSLNLHRDGRILVGGYLYYKFNAYNSFIIDGNGGILDAVLRADNNSCLDMSTQSDGKIIIGGNFTPGGISRYLPAV